MPIKTPKNKVSAKPKVAQCKQLGAKDKEVLFNKYITPNFDTIKSLVKHYTRCRQDIDDNYNYCLSQFFNYIGSYDPKAKLSTWLHIVVKRACFYQDGKRMDDASHWTDIEMCSMDDLYHCGSTMVTEMNYGTLVDNLSDKMLAILMQIPPQRLSPFMMYVQGYQIREITAAEWKLGHLEKRSEQVVKSRIYWAKKELQYILRKHGITRQNH